MEHAVSAILLDKCYAYAWCACETVRGVYMCVQQSMYLVAAVITALLLRFSGF